MVVSLNSRTPIPIIGTPKKGPLILGKLHAGFRVHRTTTVAPFARFRAKVERLSRIQGLRTLNLNPKPSTWGLGPRVGLEVLQEH